IAEINESIKLAEGPFTSKIDLAECLHLLAVMLVKQNNLALAEENLQKAIALETEFCNETHAIHFLKFTSMQSLADVKRRLKKPSEAIKLLEDVYQGQVKLFHTEEHADIAKTLHFL